jgi:hypothetical protein
LLLFSFPGVVIGLLAMLGTMFRQRRELAAAQRELKLKNKLAEIDSRRSPAQPS